MSDPHLNSMMENLYWWGIPTLFRCPNEPATGHDLRWLACLTPPEMGPPNATSIWDHARSEMCHLSRDACTVGSS